MKTIFTPGPWELEAGRNFKTTSGEFYISYGRDRYDNPKFKSFVELDNNAVLIAAAPDMYEALKALYEHCAMVHNAWGDGCNQKESDAAIKAGKAAMRKAEGIS